MPPKRKSDAADPNAARNKFQKRGDLPILENKTQFDCVLRVGHKRWDLHKAILISRSGRFAELLSESGKLPKDREGRVLLTLDTHDIKSIAFVVEFIYGDKELKELKYPPKDQPTIQLCVLLYNLGHDFDISDMVTHAKKHLGMHLSRKLKEICIYPLSKAKKAVASNKFLDDLEAGITAAYKTEYKDDLNHPQKMLMDFIVVGGEILFRDERFMLSIDQDVLPADFLKDFIKAQFGGRYQTPWMKRLMVRSDKLKMKLEKTKNQQQKNCEGCGVTTGDQTISFNPWSRAHIGQMYTQVCCEKCAQGMDEGDGKSVPWAVFDDTEE